jgi:hypothetical protein
MPYDDNVVRRGKHKLSTEARRRINFRCSWEKLMLLLATNFVRNDLYITLTYDDLYLPQSRKAADALLTKFLKSLRRQRMISGDTFYYIKSTHELAGDGERRLHHHVVINATTESRDYETVLSMWPWGSNVDISRISRSEHYIHDDFMELAKYMARERNPDAPYTTVGARSWSGSRNLKKPVRESELVEENITIEAPPGAHILESDELRNEYGTFRYLKYLLPEKKPPDKKAKRSSSKQSTRLRE